ncbi:YmfL family putative regulatory protein [Edwardsiella tarda]
MVDIKTTIKEMCKAYPGGQKTMAAQLGMTYDAFRNHLDQKCASRFFTLAEIELMEDLSGTKLFAEYSSARVGNATFEVPVPEQIDNVELYDYAQRKSIANGELAKAQREAASDGVICADEFADLASLFMASVGCFAMHFYAHSVLYGAPINNSWLFSMEGVTHQECRPGASVAYKALCGDSNA